MNAFLNEIANLDNPAYDSDEYLREEVENLIKRNVEKNSKGIYTLIKDNIKSRLKPLGYPELIALRDSLNGYSDIPHYKLAKMLGITLTNPD